MSEEINKRFDYHAPTPEKVQLHEGLRASVKDLALSFEERLPAGREKALALTHLEEALFWGNAAIARS